MTYASPSSSDSALRFFMSLVDALGVMLDRSLVCGGENEILGRGDIALVAGGACVVSSSEESSPPARARSSLSSTSMTSARRVSAQQCIEKVIRSPLRPIRVSDLKSQALQR